MFVTNTTASIACQVGASPSSVYVGSYTSHPLELRTADTPRVTIGTSGGVRFNNYGAGTLVTDSSGNITANASPTVTNLNATGTVTVNSGGSPAGTVRNITISTAAPSGGADGDVWLQYTA